MRVLVFGVLLSFWAGHVFATATTVVESQGHDSYTIGYKPGKSIQNEANNFFIRELAKFNLTNLYSTSYTFHYHIHKSLIRTQPYVYKAQVELSGEGCTGAIHYKEFNISDILSPNYADFTLIIEKKGNHLASYDFKEVAADTAGNFLVAYAFETFVNDDSLNIFIKNLALYSRSEDRQKFYERIDHINSYHAAIAAIDLSIDRIRRLKISVDGLTEIALCMKESERIFEKINTSAFIDHLRLNGGHHPEFYSRLEQFEKQLNSLSYLYDDLLEKIQQSSETISVTDLAEMYVDEVNRFLYLSREATHGHQTYFYDLAMVNYDGQRLSELMRVFETILKTTQPGNIQESLSEEIHQTIYTQFMEEAQSLAKKQNFYLSRGVLQNAAGYHRATLGDNLPLSYHTLMGKVSYGVFNSYIHLIDKAIEIGSFALAENYIVKAREFQAENTTAIISNKYIQEVSDDLVKLCIQKGFEQTDNEEYKTAITTFERASDICQHLGVENQEDTIQSGLKLARNGYYNQLLFLAEAVLKAEEDSLGFIYLEMANDLENMFKVKRDSGGPVHSLQAFYQQRIYQDIINLGRYDLKSGNYTMAYHHFLQALELEREHNLNPEYDLMIGFKTAANSYLSDQMRLAIIKVDQRKIFEAKGIYHSCHDIYTKYSELLGPNIGKKLTEVDNRIFNKECEIFFSQYQKNLLSIYELIDKGNFRAAMKLADASEDLLSVNSECQPDREALVAIKKKYRPAVTYQLKSESAKYYLSAGQYDQFVAIYRQLQDLLEQHEVIRQKIEAFPLFNYFTENENAGLIQLLIEHVSDREGLSTSLNLLHILEAGKVSAQGTKIMQTELAGKLAFIDRKTYPEIDPNELIRKYTQNSRWFRFFRKAYIKSREL